MCTDNAALNTIFVFKRYIKLPDKKHKLSSGVLSKIDLKVFSISFFFFAFFLSFVATILFLWFSQN